MAHADDVIAGLDEVIEEPKLPDTEVVIDAPPDKEPVARADDGKFKGKEGEKPEAAKEPAAKPEKEMPLAAHIEERTQWKRERDQWLADKQALEARLKALETPPAQAPAATVIPPYEENPKGYLDANLKAAIEKLESGVQATQKIAETSQKTTEQLQQDAEFSRFMGTVQALEQQYIQTQPDYYDALNYIRQMRVDELALAMPHLTQEQIQRAITSEEVGLARALLQQNKNPHAVAYRIAQRRGYKPAAAAVELPTLPDVAKPNQLAPDMTLGSSAGQSDIDEGQEDPIDAALKSVWRPQKRA